MTKDRLYELEINALIPIAETEAKKIVELSGKRSEKRVGVRDKVTGKYQYYNHCFFTEYFHKAMKRLAIEAGLRTF